MTRFMSILLLALLPLAFAASLPGSGTDYTRGLKNLDSALDSYDKRVRPGVGAGAVDIAVSMYVIRAWNYNDKDNSINLDLYFRQKWVDERLTFEGGKVKGGQDLQDKIWMPDTFFSSAINAHVQDVPSPNKFVFIESNGTVFCSSRIQTQVFCVNKSFPKTCSLEMESYGYDNSDISYSWNKGQFKPLGVDAKTFMYGDYKLKSFRNEDGSVTLSDKTYSRITAVFEIDKE